MSRNLNSKLLSEWIENHADGMAFLMKTTGLSFHTIDRMRRGKYISEANKSTRNALCASMKLPEDELFPIVRAIEGSSAS